jgi:hypothetical protein
LSFWGVRRRCDHESKCLLCTSGLQLCSRWRCPGLLLVVGGVQVNDETDRYWSEALFALTCCRGNQ